MRNRQHRFPNASSAFNYAAPKFTGLWETTLRPGSAQESLHHVGHRHIRCHFQPEHHLCAPPVRTAPLGPPTGASYVATSCIANAAASTNNANACPSASSSTNNSPVVYGWTRPISALPQAPDTRSTRHREGYDVKRQSDVYNVAMMEDTESFARPGWTWGGHYGLTELGAESRRGWPGAATGTTTRIGTGATRGLPGMRRISRRRGALHTHHSSYTPLALFLAGSETRGEAAAQGTLRQTASRPSTPMPPPCPSEALPRPSRALDAYSATPHRSSRVLSDSLILNEPPSSSPTLPPPLKCLALPPSICTTDPLRGGRYMRHVVLHESPSFFTSLPRPSHEHPLILHDHSHPPPDRILPPPHATRFQAAEWIAPPTRDLPPPIAFATGTPHPCRRSRAGRQHPLLRPRAALGTTLHKPPSSFTSPRSSFLGNSLDLSDHSRPPPDDMLPPPHPKRLRVGEEMAPPTREPADSAHGRNAPSLPSSFTSDSCERGLRGGLGQYTYFWCLTNLHRSSRFTGLPRPSRVPAPPFLAFLEHSHPPPQICCRHGRQNASELQNGHLRPHGSPADSARGRNGPLRRPSLPTPASAGCAGDLDDTHTTAPPDASRDYTVLHDSRASPVLHEHPLLPGHSLDLPEHSHLARHRARVTPPPTRDPHRRHRRESDRPIPSVVPVTRHYTPTANAAAQAVPPKGVRECERLLTKAGATSGDLREFGDVVTSPSPSSPRTPRLSPRPSASVETILCGSVGRGSRRATWEEPRKDATGKQGRKDLYGPVAVRRQETLIAHSPHGVSSSSTVSPFAIVQRFPFPFSFRPCRAFIIRT
ncbi:hypothetical protein C8R44DRAFT_856901 [Mycena epipterygia]|nr:hypothetical protein C8R44DRAFT_856901 [Mycena epipterygia]